ncbi:MAG: LuxR C-terminal-related transcriptional regulator [Acidobacteriota bacterium]|nr:LuxR C-terminal-related transcriptional regulator [Acidobacteriota bacterium]MDE3266313.1 LuxR C-terminal-related transcriptional regulator [Acidobacteriota bacterium]
MTIADRQPFPTRAFPWLLRQKVVVPDPVAGLLRRPELEERALPRRRKLTVLRASGGFGKTTLMAECCRRLRRDGVATAWISVDENDEPGVLDVYIAVACAEAGLNLLDVSPACETAGEPAGRIGTVLRAIELLERPFVMAFDELERLDSASVPLLALLLQRGPANLHLMFACREVPDGIDVASPLLAGHAEAMETEDLRFSRAEVARFFGLRLSRRALAQEIDRSAGWPVALRIARNSMAHEAGEHRHTAHRFVGNWIESRLFAALGRGDRDFVLDMALLDWIDAELLDEVLQRRDSMRHFGSMTALTGLLEPLSDGEADRWRLHPLVREHCRDRRLHEDPRRFAAVHQRIAKALAKRRVTTAAMRHAIEGSDPFLAGRIVEQAGGVRLWIRNGVPALQQANRLLTEEVVAESPRLKLLRCMALALAGHGDEARALYSTCPRSIPPSDDNDDFRYPLEDLTVRTGLALYGVSPVGSNWSETLFRDAARLTAAADLGPAKRGGIEYGLSILHFLKGEFDVALERLSEALESTGTDYIVLYGGILHGQIDFVTGRLEGARAHFRRARRIARKGFLLDPTALTSCDVVTSEIALECNPASATADPPGVLSVLTSHGAPFSYFATASNVLIGTRLRSGRADKALALADRLVLRSRTAGLTAFLRLIVALRVSVLVIAGRVAEAERAWRREALPENPADCVDLTAQSWREMEAVSEARARLLIAGRQWDEGRSLLRRLHAVSADVGLRTVEMRALALSIALEQQAGDSQAALRHLREYLRLFAESPYAWPLVRDRATCDNVLRTYVGPGTAAPHKQAARSLLAMCGTDDVDPPSFSERELDVLKRLDGRQDKEIAVELGLSAHGVRYHLRSVFAKLGARNRAEAVRRAWDMGLIPDDS